MLSLPRLDHSARDTDFRGKVSRDVARFGSIPGVQVHNFTELTSGQLTNLLRGPGTDAHHIVQDAAVRELKGYGTNAAPGRQWVNSDNSSDRARAQVRESRTFVTCQQDRSRVLPEYEQPAESLV